MILGRDILWINSTCCNILELVIRQILYYTRPNVTRHITYWAKYPSFRFVNPHWKDPINSYFLNLYPRITYCIWDINYMNTILIREPKICIVKGGVCKRIYHNGEFQEIYEKKHILGEIPIQLCINYQPSAHALSCVLSIPPQLGLQVVAWNCPGRVVDCGVAPCLGK